jgi:hypothetical protein
MVTMSTTAATNVTFRARTTMGAAFLGQGTSLPIVRRDVHVERDGQVVSAGFGACGYDAISVETTGLASVKATPLGHRAWSPPL